MIRRSIRAVRTDLAGVVGFLTRLPVGALMPRDPRFDMARAVWVFPLAGALAGACGGAVFMAGSWIGLPPLLSACWSLGAMLLFTGALHEDGLADMLDGFGGGRDREHKLAIMRDSRIGSYGALGIGLSSLLRVTAAATFTTPARACAGLIAAGALSRAAIVLLLLLLVPARRDGLAAPLHPVPRLPACLALAIALLLAGLLLPGKAALAAGAGAVIAVLALAALARRQIGGHTGDVLGACSVAAESVVLTILASR